MLRREYRELDIAEIVVKNRLRSDLGEMGTLTNSIRKHGLLCPLVVDKNNVLIAGLRRIEACRQAGLSRVPVFKVNTGYKEIEALDIQSDENICRQPLTQDELERQIQLKKKAMRGGPSKVLGNFFSSLGGFFTGKK